MAPLQQEPEAPSNNTTSGGLQRITLPHIRVLLTPLLSKALVTCSVIKSLSHFRSRTLISTVRFSGEPHGTDPENRSSSCQRLTKSGYTIDHHLGSVNCYAILPPNPSGLDRGLWTFTLIIDGSVCYICRCLRNRDRPRELLAQPVRVCPASQCQYS